MSNVICYSCDYFRKNEELRKENDKLRKHLKTALGTLKKYADKNRWDDIREPIDLDCCCVMADSVEGALCKTADIYNSMGMTGDNINISIMKVANIEMSRIDPKTKKWNEDHRKEPEAEPQAVER